MIYARVAALVSKHFSAVAVIAVGMLLLLANTVINYKRGWNARDKQALAQSNAQQMQALQQLLVDQDINARIAGDYVLRRAATQLRTITLRQEVPRVVTRYIPAPGAAPVPLPQCVFTRGFVGVWNRALAEPQLQLSAGAAAGAAAADTAAEHELVDAGINQADLLDNHIANAEVDRVVRNQCEAVLAIARRYQEQP